MKRKKELTLDEAVEILEEFGDLEGSEMGELWMSLVNLTRCHDYFLGDFSKALEKEIILQAKNAKDTFKIVEEKGTYTIRKLREKNDGR